MTSPFEIAPGTQWEPGLEFAHQMFPPEREWPRYAAIAQPKLPRMGDISVRSALAIHRGTANRSRHARPVLVLGVDAPGAGHAELHDQMVTHAEYAALPSQVREHLVCRVVDRLEPIVQKHTIARARFACPVTLLVLTPKPAVARWASRPIDLGHPGYTLQPIVIGFPQVPRITQAARARAAPELAVLSALAHPELAVVKAALGAFDVLTEDHQKLYWDVIHAGLPATVRRALEASMKAHEYQSEFARKYYSQGREQGREEGLRSAIIELVCARLPRLRDELAGRLSAQPEALLTRIVAELGKARNERELRAVLDRVLGAAPAARRRRRTAGPASPARSAGRHEPRRSRRAAASSM